MHKLWKHKNGTYYALHGPRLRSRASLRTKDREAADTLFAQFIAANSSQAPDAPTLNDILDSFQSSRLLHGRSDGEKLRSPNSLRYAVKSLKAEFGKLQPRHLMPKTIQDFARNRGASDGTILREVGILRAAISWAVQNRWFTRDHAPEISNPVPTPKGHDIWLTRAEAKRLLAACQMPHLRLFVMIGLMTGARTGAILELTWAQIDLKKRLIDFGEGHGNKRRAIAPINADLMRAINAAKEISTSDYVIEYHGRPIAFPKNGFEAAIKRAKITKHITPHIMRHTCCTWLVEAGMSYQEIGKLVGDRAETIEKIYGHHSPTFLKRATTALQFKVAAE